MNGDPALTVEEVIQSSQDSIVSSVRQNENIGNIENVNLPGGSSSKPNNPVRNPQPVSIGCLSVCIS